MAAQAADGLKAAGQNGGAANMAGMGIGFGMMGNMMPNMNNMGAMQNPIAAQQMQQAAPQAPAAPAPAAPEAPATPAEGEKPAQA